VRLTASVTKCSLFCVDEEVEAEVAVNAGILFELNSIVHDVLIGGGIRHTFIHHL